MDWIEFHEPKINLLVNRSDAAEQGMHKLEITLKQAIRDLDRKYEAAVTEVADMIHLDALAETIRRINDKIASLGAQPFSQPEEISSQH